MGVRLYGNQRGTFVRFTGQDARDFDRIAVDKGMSPERMLAEIVRWYAARVGV